MLIGTVRYENNTHGLLYPTVHLVSTNIQLIATKDKGKCRDVLRVTTN